MAGLQSGAASLAGFALLLGSAATWAVGSIVVKRAPADLPLMRLLLWQCVYGVVPLAVVGVLVGGDVDWGPALVGAVLWAGAVASAGGFALQFALLRRGQASVVSAWAFAVPVISTALGVTVRDEGLTAGLVLGAAAVARLHLARQPPSGPRPPTAGLTPESRRRPGPRARSWRPR